MARSTKLDRTILATDKAKLDAITNVGSGQIITASERSLLYKDSCVVSVSSANAATNYNTTAGAAINFGTVDLTPQTGGFSTTNQGANTLYNGRVELKAVIRIVGVSANAGLDFRFRRNGVLIGATANANIESLTSSARATCYLSGIFDCATNDVWDLWAIREAGNGVNTAINLTQGSILSFKQC